MGRDGHRAIQAVPGDADGDGWTQSGREGRGAGCRPDSIVFRLRYPEQEREKITRGCRMGFARDHWYVVASSAEVGENLLARTVLGNHLVLYRTKSGAPVALPDRCPHRRYPLSQGHLIGDEIQCSYHGLRFDSCGTCVWVPGQERIPSKANLTPRPLVEDGAWIWAWMGDPAAPDHSRRPHTPWFSLDGWTEVHGMEPLDASYGLLVDNLLDLSHETFLHAGFIGTPEVAATPTTTTIDEDS